MFQKKGTLSQKQPGFTSSYDKHKGINSCLSNSKNYVCKIDLKDAYFSIPVHKDSRKAVRFLWAGNLHEFLYLCFGLGPAPRIFTKLLKVPISVLRRLMIRVIIYLDDLFILGKVGTKYLWQGTLWSSCCNI